MSSAPDALPSPVHSPSISLRSELSIVTCSDETDVEAPSENETLADSTSSLPNSPAINKVPTGIDRLVRHMVDGAHSVADVDELLEAGMKSFELIAQWFAEIPVCIQPSPALHNYTRAHLTYSCGDPVIANGARSAGRDYIKTIKESVKVAGKGVIFANDVIELCNLLSKHEGLDARGKSFIEEMRTIVQQALSEAETTNHKFRDIRAKLFQV